MYSAFSRFSRVVLVWVVLFSGVVILGCESGGNTVVEQVEDIDRDAAQEEYDQMMTPEPGGI